jgi:hypothetical protein
MRRQAGPLSGRLRWLNPGQRLRKGLIAEEVAWAGSPRLLAGIGWELRLVAVARPDRGGNGAGRQTTQRPGGPALALVRDGEERLRSCQPAQPRVPLRLRRCHSSTGIRDAIPICKGAEEVDNCAPSDHPWRDSAPLASDGSLANRRMVRPRVRVTAIVLVCPACGADRLIPLTFPIYQREAGPEVVLLRPMAKCSACGERVFVKIIARQRLSKRF